MTTLGDAGAGTAGTVVLEPSSQLMGSCEGLQPTPPHIGSLKTVGRPSSCWQLGVNL
jgi:hypothetical protein